MTLFFKLIRYFFFKLGNITLLKSQLNRYDLPVNGYGFSTNICNNDACNGYLNYDNQPE